MNLPRSKKLSKKKKLLLAAGTLILVGVGVVAVGVTFISKRNQMKDAIQPSFTTETAKIERQTLSDSISATGTIASAETKTVNTSLKDLEVVAVYVKEGEDTTDEKLYWSQTIWWTPCLAASSESSLDIIRQIKLQN